MTIEQENKLIMLATGLRDLSKELGMTINLDSVVLSDSRIHINTFIHTPEEDNKYGVISKIGVHPEDLKGIHKLQPSWYVKKEDDWVEV